MAPHESKPNPRGTDLLGTGSVRLIGGNVTQAQNRGAVEAV